jgi:hypothetical protein
MGMREYHKIDTIYKRAEDGTKKLIEGSWRDQTVESIKDIDWVWTEKVDGTNIRVHWDGHKVTFGGRTDKAQIPADLVNFLNEKFGTPEAEELFEQKFGDTTAITLVGEGYGRKIQKVGSLYLKDSVSFIMFDAMVDCTGGGHPCWLRRDSVEDIATAFGVDVVPIVGVGTLEQAVNFIKTKPVSALSPDAPMEGVVARPAYELLDRMGRRLIVKIKAHDFEEG